MTASEEGNTLQSPSTAPVSGSGQTLTTHVAQKVATATPSLVDVKRWETPRLPDKMVPKATGWNTKNLGLRSMADVTAALSAGVLVAPLITMIDRGIMENASGRNTLSGSLSASFRTLLLRPHRFLFSKPFAFVLAVYSGTYMTANTVDTISSTVSSKPASTVTSGLTKFVSSSTANITLGLYKDSCFTKYFGVATSVPRSVPGPTYALFTIRDCMTIFASFNIPPMLAPRLEKAFSEDVRKRISGAHAAQFLAPASIQILSTPLHLLGLDLYNRPGMSLADRTHKIWTDWGKSCLARMGRIVPAFGVGGVVNMSVRKRLMEKLE